MQANMRSKKLSSNVISSANHNILKSACIYGANNAGKTCLIRVLHAAWSVIVGKPMGTSPNLYSNNPVVSITCGFLDEAKEWNYAFSYDAGKGEFVSEQLSRISYDVYGNKKTTTYFIHDFKMQKFDCLDEKNRATLPLLGKTSSLIHLVDTTTLPYLQEAKKAMLHFADSLVIIDMNNIPMQKTIDMLK
jgi:AAA15 family ATPase/GTPase